jgi:quercetin dioxygenase-like cupin family protein
MPEARRVVVTTTNGRSHVESDGVPPVGALGEVEGYGPMLSIIWQADMPPAHTRAGADPNPESFTPGQGHGVFRALRLVIGPGGGFPIGASETLDVACILSGAIDLILPDETVPLQAGDWLVLQGDEHGWNNPHDEACVIMASMLGAPLPS